jgi:hypothetical protein
VALGTPQGMENGGEFFREREQAAVRGRLLIAQRIDKGSGRQASRGDAFGDPGLVDFSEEAADLVPACSLAGLAGLADQHHEKVETMAGSIDHAVGRGTNGIAERGQQLEEDGGGMGFAVWGQAAYGQPRDAVECGIAEDWIRGRTGRRRCGRRRGGLSLCLWLKPQLFAGEFGHPTLYVGQSSYGWTAYLVKRFRLHDLPACTISDWYRKSLVSWSCCRRRHNPDVDKGAGSRGRVL